jgi:hypothetical protein
MISRHWYRFSLRKLLVLVTVVCVYLGWAMNWIRQRHEFLTRPNTIPSYGQSVNRAPWPILWLGESPVRLLLVEDASDEQFEEAERLFPEASIMFLN